MKLVALDPIDVEAVRAIVPKIEVVQATRESAVDAARDADVVIGNPGARWRDVLKTAKSLRWVHVSSAGVDGLLCPELQAAPAVLTCAKGSVAGPVLAEHAFALILGLTRGIALSVRDGRWNRQDGAAGKAVFELGGKTLGLVGFGGVGRHLARMAHAFSMDVIAVRRSPGGSVTEDVTLWGTGRFTDMLERADVVVVSVPDTPETRGMFNAEAFRHMKKNALLVAVGRGKTVDTPALVEALKRREIAGAGLDVVDPEPLPNDHPLWKMRNVIITPHIAGNSPERAKRNQALVLENLKRFAKGEPLTNVVDKEAGY